MGGGVCCNQGCYQCGGPWCSAGCCAGPILSSGTYCAYPWSTSCILGTGTAPPPPASTEAPSGLPAAASSVLAIGGGLLALGCLFFFARNAKTTLRQRQGDVTLLAGGGSSLSGESGGGVQMGGGRAFNPNDVITIQPVVAAATPIGAKIGAADGGAPVVQATAVPVGRLALPVEPGAVVAGQWL